MQTSKCGLSSSIQTAIDSAKKCELYGRGYIRAKISRTTSKQGISSTLCLANTTRFFNAVEEKTSGPYFCGAELTQGTREIEEVLSLFPVGLATLIKQGIIDAGIILDSSATTSLQEIRLDIGLPVRVAVLEVTGLNDEDLDVFDTCFQKEDACKYKLPQMQSYCIAIKDSVIQESDILNIIKSEVLEVADMDRNRYHIKNTMHRVSLVLDSELTCSALTIRIARNIPNAADILSDIVLNKESGSILVIGPPGCGKTTLMRSMILLAAGDVATGCNAANNVFVIDTCKEFSANTLEKRMDVLGYARLINAEKKNQNEIMEEVVMNHFPTILAIDELEPRSTSAVRRIASSGVRLFATAHASTLQEALYNPIIAPLLGDVHTVVRGDSCISQSSHLKKSALERTKEPIFDTVIQINKFGYFIWQEKPHLCAGIDEILQATANESELTDFGAPQCRTWCSLKSKSTDETNLLLSTGWQLQ